MKGIVTVSHTDNGKKNPQNPPLNAAQETQNEN